MIYYTPAGGDPIDQGDLIDNCPFLLVAALDPAGFQPPQIDVSYGRALVLTQTCDLANEKVDAATIAAVFVAQKLVDEGVVKRSDLRGPIRASRVYGWYFLPHSVEFGLPEMIVDLRQLHTVRLDLLTDLCRRGQRPARLQPPYREHLAQHFSNTYGRIGLPQPYETL